MGAKVWNSGGERSFLNLTTAVGKLAFTDALEAMRRDFPTMLEYLETSEKAQDVFSTLDLLTMPWLEWSYTRYALIEHCKLFGVTLPHNKLGAPTVSTNNAVEAENGVDKNLGIRYLPPLTFFAQKLQQQSARLQSILLSLSPPNRNTLIPHVHAVFQHTKKVIASYCVRSVGLGGELVLQHLIESRSDGGLYTNVNVTSRTCNNPDCVRVAATGEACSHLLSGYQFLGLLSQPDFLQKNYPLHFQREVMLACITATAPFKAPNLQDMGRSESVALRRAPATEAEEGIISDGRPKNNVIRYPSRGEFF